MDAIGRTRVDGRTGATPQGATWVSTEASLPAPKGENDSRGFAELLTGPGRASTQRLKSL